MGSFTFKLEDGEPSSTNSACHKAKTVILRLFHSSSKITLTAYKLLPVVECDQNKLLFNSSGGETKHKMNERPVLFCAWRLPVLFPLWAALYRITECFLYYDSNTDLLSDLGKKWASSHMSTAHHLPR